LELRRQRLALVGEAAQRRLQFARCLAALLGSRSRAQRAVEFCADRISGTDEAVHDEADLAAQRFEERVDDRARVLAGEVVLLGRAEIDRPGGLGRTPALAV